jgi:hypothetical protein
MHAMEGREPMIVDVVGQPDVELDLERFRDVLGEATTEGSSGGREPGGEVGLVHNKGGRVVALPAARLPQRRLPSEHHGQRIRVGEQLDADRLVERGQPGLVREQLPAVTSCLPFWANSGQ